jgi:acyl-CoA synthetase (AMP-forming)/AMP-acid ligase II
MVPLTQANLCQSAHNIAATLALTPSDRCLNVMPLFHIHGLMAALLASLKAGASVVCTPGFQGDRFFDWMQTFSPTWYSAVPTMHQTVLAQASHHQTSLLSILCGLFAAPLLLCPPPSWRGWKLNSTPR